MPVLSGLLLDDSASLNYVSQSSGQQHPVSPLAAATEIFRATGIQFLGRSFLFLDLKQRLMAAITSVKSSRFDSDATFIRPPQPSAAAFSDDMIHYMLPAEFTVTNNSSLQNQ